MKRLKASTSPPQLSTAARPVDPQEAFRVRLVHVLPLAAVFLLLRLLFLLHFPIFNDEVNSIQWTQFMVSDWDKFKYVSVDNVYSNWRPPLTFWLASVPLRLIDDPLLAARLTSVSVSLIGLLSVYAFAGYFFGSVKTALWVGLLWTLNPMNVFYDREFVTETFVYSFSAATYLFTYLALSKQRRYAIPAILFGALAMLSKQSGQLYVYGLIFFGALQIRRQAAGRTSRLVVEYANIAHLVLIMAGSIVLYRLAIPAEYFKDYGSFNNQFLFTLREILDFPLAAWKGNVERIFLLFRHYYSLLSVPLILVFLYRCAVQKRPHDLLVAAWFAFNTVLLIIPFKFYNEYMYNTSNILFLTLMLGAAAHQLQEWGGTLLKTSLVQPFFRYSGAALLVAALWTYQLAYYYTSPKDYIEKFGSPWMKLNYLHGWPSGFGLPEAMELLAKERNKYVIVDPQWGNPGTTFEVYNRSFPTLQILPLSTQILEALKSVPPNRAVAIFRYRQRGFDDALLASPVCVNKKIIKVVEQQTPLYYCYN